jgi:nitronate monooxygenase
MAAWTREETLAFLNLMLEAERAGARALLHVAKDAGRADVAAMAGAIQKDEAHWCAMLIGAIKKLNGQPSEATGAFYDKVMALTDDKERLALVNRGQDWVVRKLREALPRIADGGLAKNLSVMLTSHEDNIAKVSDSGLIG